jgi:hypothetical protein
MFPTQKVNLSRFTSLYPLVANNDGSDSTWLFLPHEFLSYLSTAPFTVLVAFDYHEGSIIGLLLAVGAFSYYHLLTAFVPAS